MFIMKDTCMVYTVRKHRQLIVYDTDAIFIMLQSNFFI